MRKSEVLPCFLSSMLSKVRKLISIKMCIRDRSIFYHAILSCYYTVKIFINIIISNEFIKTITFCNYFYKFLHFMRLFIIGLLLLPFTNRMDNLTQNSTFRRKWFCIFKQSTWVFCNIYRKKQNSISKSIYLTQNNAFILT